jgi:hypothetical protein
MKINNLILELNSNCNSNCLYCYLKDVSQDGGDTHDFFDGKLFHHSKKGIPNVDFTGGEPTLYKELPRLIRRAANLGYTNRSLVTNGRMLSCMPFTKRLCSAGLTRAIITLDGPDPARCDSITRTPGSYEQTVRGIRNAKRCGLELGITLVITKQTYRYAGETLKRALDLGADFISIQYMLPFIEDPHVDCRKIPGHIIPTYAETWPYVKRLLDEHSHLIRIGLHFIPFCKAQGYEHHLDMDANKYDRLAVNFRGFEYNIGEHLAKDAVKTEKCRSCRFSGRCAGFFRSYARQLGIADELGLDIGEKTFLVNSR